MRILIILCLVISLGILYTVYKTIELRGRIMQMEYKTQQTYEQIEPWERNLSSQNEETVKEDFVKFFNNPNIRDPFRRGGRHAKKER